MEKDKLEIGVVLEAFLDHSLEDALQFLSTNAPEVSFVEVGAGGYAPHPHCDIEDLLANKQARSNWLNLLEKYNIKLDAFNAWGNTLHPNKEIAKAHDSALRNAIRLASELGAERVVAMSGCPGGVVHLRLLTLVQVAGFRILRECILNNGKNQ